eukprot:68914_1
MFTLRRIFSTRIGVIYSLKLSKRQYNYKGYGMVTNIIWGQPSWSKAISHSTRSQRKMWQIFEVGLFHSLTESRQETEFVRCTGYAPCSLSPGQFIHFQGDKQYSKKYECEVIRVHDINEKDEQDDELIEISQYAKGIGFKCLFILRQKFQDQLCAIIQHSPQSLKNIPGTRIGPVKLQTLQSALHKSSIDTDSIPSPQFTYTSEPVIKSKKYDRDEWINDWCSNDTYAVEMWFKSLNVAMYGWNNYYAPTRKSIGQIENYIHMNDDTYIDTAIDILLEQSQVFSTTLLTLNADDFKRAERNITRLMSAEDWLTDCEDVWMNRLRAQCQEDPNVAKMMNVLMNSIDRIVCIDTEFFIGKYEYKHRDYGYHVPLELAIGRLYNIGIASTDTKPLSLLIKHPTLSLEDRLNLFSSPRGKRTMLQFLKPVLQQHIDEEASEEVDVGRLDSEQLEMYFDRYAVDPHAAWDVLYRVIQEFPYLMYHYSEWDRKLVVLLAEYCGAAEEIKSFEWLNTLKLCHALFPRSKVISHSLGYLSKRLCKGIDMGHEEHLGGHDAMALMELSKTLQQRMANVGIEMMEIDGVMTMKTDDSTANNMELDEVDGKECELYEWLVNIVKLSEYYEMFCHEEFDDDMSVISELSDADLQELGVEKEAHRVKILTELGFTRIGVKILTEAEKL